jgi:hypothetical protein
LCATKPGIGVSLRLETVEPCLARPGSFAKASRDGREMPVPVQE